MRQIVIRLMLFSSLSHEHNIYTTWHLRLQLTKKNFVDLLIVETLFWLGHVWQIRCKNTSHCTKEGTIVTLTDLNRNNQTDFVISSRAFMAMAQKGMGQDILKLGIVDVEYKR